MGETPTLIVLIGALLETFHTLIDGNLLLHVIYPPGIPFIHYIHFIPAPYLSNYYISYSLSVSINDIEPSTQLTNK